MKKLVFFSVFIILVIDKIIVFSAEKNRLFLSENITKNIDYENQLLYLKKRILLLEDILKIFLEDLIASERMQMLKTNNNSLESLKNQENISFSNIAQPDYISSDIDNNFDTNILDFNNVDLIDSNYILNDTIAYLINYLETDGNEIKAYNSGVLTENGYKLNYKDITSNSSVSSIVGATVMNNNGLNQNTADNYYIPYRINKNSDSYNDNIKADHLSGAVNINAIDAIKFYVLLNLSASEIQELEDFKRNAGPITSLEQLKQLKVYPKLKKFADKIIFR